MMSSLLTFILFFGTLVGLQGTSDAFRLPIPNKNNNDKKINNISSRNDRGTVVGKTWRMRTFSFSSSPSDVADDEVENDEDLKDGPVKSELLAAIADSARGDDDAVVFGGGFGGSTTSSIDDLAKQLENKYVLPLDKPSEWKLLYTNAPDFLGIKGGPLSQLVSIQQQFSASSITLSLLYKPSDGLLPQLVGNLLSEDITNDRLTQEVVFEYEEKNANVYLRLQSTTIGSTRFGSLPTLPIPIGTPFVEALRMVFNDADLRMERTIQGDFLVIYKRC